MNPGDADELLDSELKGLPRPRAPRTLLPRVLAAAADRRAVPSPSGWSTWSWQGRAASLAACAVMVIAVWLVASEPPGTVVKAAETASDFATVMRVLREVLLQPLAIYFFGLTVLFALTCAAAWAAMEAALGGASQR
jgi:hypothetical protein